MARPVLVDLRNIYPVAEASDAGFAVTRVGGSGAE
jgi:UDPglucose 6-dehydrogenase